MISYIVIMSITKLSVFFTQILLNLRKTRGPLRGTVCLLEGI